jgi:hypothetical protein
MSFSLLYSQTFIEHCLPRLKRGITQILQIYTDKDKNLCKSDVSASPVRQLPGKTNGVALSDTVGKHAFCAPRHVTAFGRG